MALIECSECGSEISSKASACPKCGNPLDPVRRAYVEALAATIAADGAVDADEIRKLYEIHALLGTSEADRLNLIRRLALEPQTFTDVELPEEILRDEELRMALAKDLLFIEKTQESNATKQVVQQLLAQIRLTPEQTKVMTDWVTWENQLLRRMGAGDECLADESDPREIASRAAAVGVPLTMLYMAGTRGFSAPGITSGLASLGKMSGLAQMGQLAGLVKGKLPGLAKLKVGWNPMTAGIAALIIAGVTVKKLSDFAAGISNREAKVLRERLEEFRTVQLSAATRLAGDIPRLEGVLGAEPDDRSAQVLSDMQVALRMIEDGTK